MYASDAVSSFVHAALFSMTQVGVNRSTSGRAKSTLFKWSRTLREAFSELKLGHHFQCPRVVGMFSVCTRGRSARDFNCGGSLGSTFETVSISCKHGTTPSKTNRAMSNAQSSTDILETRLHNHCSFASGQGAAALEAVCSNNKSHAPISHSAYANAARRSHAGVMRSHHTCISAFRTESTAGTGGMLSQGSGILELDVEFRRLQRGRFEVIGRCNQANFNCVAQFVECCIVGSMRLNPRLHV